MKKNFINIILFFIIISSQNVNASHYKNIKKIEMEIFRNNELIGYNHYFFTRDKDITIIKNEIKLTVKLLGTIVFKIEGYGEEIYKKENLISFNSKTKQNKKDKFVILKLDEKNNEFIINGSSYNGKAKTNNIIGNWWNHNLLQANSQISPVSGSIKRQIITFISKEKIELYGKTFNTEHYNLKSADINIPNDKKLNFDIWFDKNSDLILKVKYSKMGNWEYRLKNYD